MGVLDFAVGSVVHMSAGFAALAGAMFLRPRRDYFHSSHPANIPFVLFGAGILWFGLFGFYAGSALAANSVIRMFLEPYIGLNRYIGSTRLFPIEYHSRRVEDVQQLCSRFLRRRALLIFQEY